MENKKYAFTNEIHQTNPRLKRIVSLITIDGVVEAGDTGGWIESEKNLDMSGNARVYGDAQVSGNARVYGNAQVSGNARLYGDAWVYGNAQVYGDAQVYCIAAFCSMWL